MEVSSDLAGRKSRPYDIELTARRTTNYAAGTLDPNPRYFDDERPGGTIAPPMLAASLTWHMTLYREAFWETHDFPPDIAARQVHYSEHLILHQPMRPGQHLTIQAEVAAVIPHRAGTHLIVRYDATANGEPVFTEYAGAMLRDVRCTDGGKGKEPSAEGGRFGKREDQCWEKTLRVDPLAAYLYDGCGDVHNPIHTSPAFAHAVGLPGPILHGTATLAYAVREIVQTEAGDDPGRVAGIRAHFTGMVMPGTDIRIEMLGREEEAGLTHCHFLVWNAEDKRAIRNACVSLKT
ncbi:MAG: hypothetical protein RLZZ303_1963 [Candidatus Hydrogenedentota bacterium]|jgi:acyl dehydratase